MPVPSNPKQQVLLKLPMFRLFLERNQYFPGETIRGQVTLNIGEPKKMRGVRIQFWGKQQTYILKQETYHTSNVTITHCSPYYSYLFLREQDQEQRE